MHAGMARRTWSCADYGEGSEPIRSLTLVVEGVCKRMALSA
jgi:hypothetical protein